MDNKTDYRQTLCLPQTDFPMKANLPTREPEQIKSWLSNDIYKKIQKKNKGKPLFALPDGPPYANGNIHIGHCLNKVLKDIVVKYKALSGFQSVFIPGWDCHGLPIEHAVAKELGPKRKEKSDNEIRSLCRDYAHKWINVQKGQFQRLGVLADWENPYLTLDKKFEADVVRSLAQIYHEGHMYRGEKPVHWCWNDGTSLAEAEVEYADRVDPSIYVKFETNGPLGKLHPPYDKAKTYFVIWTTTPWTLPANLAISLNPDIEYGFYDVGGEVWILAVELKKNLEAALQKKLKTAAPEFKLIESHKGSSLGGKKPCGKDFDGAVCKHPFVDRLSYVILGDHVTLDAGTGCVHTAPGHGMEDYIVGLKYGLEAFNPVDEWGRYTDKFEAMKGTKVFDANTKVVEQLEKSGHLILEEKLNHSFPHCWRCHNPVIFRATAQWFIAMDGKNPKGSIRTQALNEIKKVKWIPAWGENRITAMVENSPDWCISRQRLWGVPIPVFYCTQCYNHFTSTEVMKKVADKIEAGGIEAWQDIQPKDFVGNHKCKCGNSEFKAGKDILDVWFDSGVVHKGVQDEREGLSNPCDLYLEGSDQHRGWFQSSLKTAIAMNGKAPYKQVLTHGFVVDGQGRKMSKSLGNVVDPIKFMEKSGAEIIRLWTAYEDYTNDVQTGQESFDRISESYRRVRNTCRYILGNLSDFNPEKDMVPFEKMQEIDRWALAKLAQFLETIRNAYDSYQFHTIYHALQNYCTVDLSAVYLDILKDRLYTSKKDGLKRRSAQTAMYIVLDNLIRSLAPILSFLSEEVYQVMPGKKQESVFLTEFPTMFSNWKNDALVEKWEKILNIRSLALKQLEEARSQKTIGASLEAQLVVTVPAKDLDVFKSIEQELTQIFIVSQLELRSGPEASVVVQLAHGKKCERCWNYSDKIGSNSKFIDVCEKCVEALA